MISLLEDLALLGTLAAFIVLGLALKRGRPQGQVAVQAALVGLLVLFWRLLHESSVPQRMASRQPFGPDLPGDFSAFGEAPLQAAIMVLAPGIYVFICVLLIMAWVLLWPRSEQALPMFTPEQEPEQPQGHAQWQPSSETIQSAASMLGQAPSRFAEVAHAASPAVAQLRVQDRLQALPEAEPSDGDYFADSTMVFEPDEAAATPILQVVPDMPEPALQVVPDMPEPSLQVVPDMPEPSLQVVPDVPEPSLQVVPDVPEPEPAAVMHSQTDTPTAEFFTSYLVDSAESELVADAEPATSTPARAGASRQGAAAARLIGGRPGRWRG